eukprot:COSAG02_NODE_14628_length_1253_cov_1.184575_1_plen_28_part_10
MPAPSRPREVGPFDCTGTALERTGDGWE